MKKHPFSLIATIFVIAFLIIACHTIQNHKNQVNVYRHKIIEKVTDLNAIFLGYPYISTRNRTINCLGDSITEGYLNDGISWADRLQTLTYAKAVNKYGIGGSTVSTFADQHPMCLRYNEMDSKADFIVIFGGNNDFTQSVPLGNEDDVDTKTFYGGLNVLLLGLREKYPTGKFLYVTPLRMWDYQHPKWSKFVQYNERNRVGLTLLDYRNAIVNRCNYYEIPYLDLYNQGLYGSTKTTRDAVYHDGLHPNDNGHRIIASQIANALMKL